MQASQSAYDIIQKTVDFIECNIKSRLSLDRISSGVSLSKFHLDRIFKAVTGLQLMNYVRQRKLSCSIGELLNTDMKIIDISCEYGFEYEQSYIRSFMQYFGISPDKLRRQRDDIKIQDKLNIPRLKTLGGTGLIIEPSIVIKPTFRLLGIKNRINLEDDRIFSLANKAGNDFFFNHLPKIENVVNPHVYHAYIEYPADEPGYSHYVPSACIKGYPPIPDGMVLTDVPANKYAVFKYIGLHHPKYTNTAYMHELNRYICSEWLPESGYRISAPYKLERIDSSIAAEDYCEVEIFLPVEQSI